MKETGRVFGLLCLFTFLILTNHCWAQNEKGSSDDKPSVLEKVQTMDLDSLKSGVWVHYEKGQKGRAERLGRLAHEALKLFRDSLGIDINMRVALLDSVSWQKVRAAPYGLQGIEGENPGIAVMPANSKGIVYRNFYAVKDHMSDELRQRAADIGYSWDKIARTKVELVIIHELGHIYHEAYGIGKPSKWFVELMAGYFATLYFHLERPEMAEVWELLAHAVSTRYTPEHKTLEEFERLYTKVGGADYVWYQANFEIQAIELVKNHGFSFLRNMKKMFPEGTAEMPPQKVVEKLNAEYPGFKEWAKIFKPKY